MIGNNDDYIVSYAQNREDVLLAAFFFKQEKGFYVDVGANDPEADSVTKYFYDRGWHGINIEPSPRLHAALSRARPNDLNLNVGVSDKKGKLSFREYAGHGLSTFSEDTKAELAAGDNPWVAEYRDYDVPVRRLDDILAEAKVGEIDFMKIDVEGYEYEVINGNDWKKFRPRVLCIEANHVHHDWRKVLEKADYTKVFFDGLNEYYIDAKRPAPKFEYVLGVIGRPIINAFAAELMKATEQERNRLREELTQAKNRIREADLEFERTQVYLVERTRVKNLAKDLFRKVNSVITVRMRHHTKRKWRYPAINLELNPEKKHDVRAVLTLVQQADHQAFRMKPSLANQLEIGLFTSLLFIYKKVTWLLLRVLKLVWKVLRKMIRIVRHG
jgi:FkbM family methyltransferase